MCLIWIGAKLCRTMNLEGLSCHLCLRGSVRDLGFRESGLDSNFFANTF